MKALVQSHPLPVSYYQGNEFLRECKRIGCRVLLLTVEKLRDADRPHRRHRRGVSTMPDLFRREDVIHGVTLPGAYGKHRANHSLDEFDLEIGLGASRTPARSRHETTVRHFATSAMRMRAQWKRGSWYRKFVPIINYDSHPRVPGRVPPRGS
jgi:hypothetical protein